MDLADWRERITQVDRRILALLNERVGYVLGLVPLKRKQGIPVHEPGRERQVLDTLKHENQGPLSDDAICRIFEAVMMEMRAIQSELKEARSEDGASEKTPGETRKSVSI